MKMLLTVAIPHEPFNSLVRSGKAGEIIGGSQRVGSYDLLLKRVDVVERLQLGQPPLGFPPQPVDAGGLAQRFPHDP